MSTKLHRRQILRAGMALLGTGCLGACDRLSNNERSRRALAAGEDATLFVQRLLLSPSKLAPEYPATAISSYFKPNGSTDPDAADYVALRDKHFETFHLKVDGLVEAPSRLSLDELRHLPSRDQITRHDCVEGWSCIGRWTGVSLSSLLDTVRLKPEARYIVFHCADVMENSLTGPVRYYESIDLTDAYHPQTILAYDMNGKALPVAHGAPLRLRLERQLGYKMAKYVMRVEVTSSLDGIGDGSGGYWEDRGYEWYAGI